MGVPTRTQIAVVVDCAARLAWNFARQKAWQEEDQTKDEDTLPVRQNKNQGKGQDKGQDQARNKQHKKEEEDAKKPAAQNWQEATLDVIFMQNPGSAGAGATVGKDNSL